MNARQTGFSVLLLIAAYIAGSGLIAPRAEAQKARASATYDYKVLALTYNPGERVTEDARAAQYERVFNQLAGQGWEPVMDFLDRSNVQSIGGGLTTRDTISFIAFRRPR